MRKRLKVFVVINVSLMLFNNGIKLVKAESLDINSNQDVIVQNVQENIPVYSSIAEWEASGDTSDVVRIKNKYSKYQGGYSEYRYVDTMYSNDTRVGYHPDFNSWIYSDAYYFSSTNKTTFSPSVSLSWGQTLSVGVSVAKSGSSGFVKNADGSRRSRPWVRADIATKRYDMYLYNEFGQLEGIYRKVHNVSTTSDVQIFIDHI